MSSFKRKAARRQSPPRKASRMVDALTRGAYAEDVTLLMAAIVRWQTEHDDETLEYRFPPADVMPIGYLDTAFALDYVAATPGSKECLMAAGQASVAQCSLMQYRMALQLLAKNLPLFHWVWHEIAVEAFQEALKSFGGLGVLLNRGSGGAAN